VKDFFLRYIVKLTALRVGILFTAACLFLSAFEPGFLRRLENEYYDLRLKARGPLKPLDKVVLAAIDEKSLDEIGRWPWPRTRIAELVDRLTEYGAKVIAFDAVFPEPDVNSTLREVRSLQEKMNELGVRDKELSSYLGQMERGADTDRALADALQRSDRSILGYFFHVDMDKANALPQEKREEGFSNIVFSSYAVKFSSQAAAGIKFEEAYAAEANLKAFSDAAKGSGFFNVFPEEDGVVRKVPLIMVCQGEFFPPLSLRALYLYFGEEPILNIEEAGVRGVWIGGVEVPTDEKGRMLINYRGGQKTFPQYSVADILQGRVDPSAFKDKIVLIGGTAIGLFDRRVTPFDTFFPGPEIHANIIDNILQQDFLRRPGWFKPIEYLVIIFVGTLFSLLLPRIRAVYGFLAAAVCVALYVYVDRFFFQQLRVWLNIVFPVLTIIFVYIGITLYRYVTEEREKAKIRGAFSVYVAPAVVDVMLKHPEKLKLGGEKKELTVLFSDIRGFTTISEGLAADELVRLLNEYLTAMTNMVFKHEGTVDKYMGDAIMAIFGAPVEQPDHAIRCCNTALDMMSELKALQAEWARKGTPKIDIGIGVNTGVMSVGNMGSSSRFDYTVMGDSVNLGSRLEGLNKEYGTNIIISEFTHEKVKDHFFCRELDLVKVKGKNKPVRIFQLLGRDGVADNVRSAVECFHQGLECYRNQEWSKADELFRRTLSLNPEDKTASLYLGRCNACQLDELPSDWDGVFTCKTK
jgi:adenylate cyclase